MFQTYYDERSDFSTGVQDMLSYQHGLCMKKGCVNIKCSNELKTSGEEQNREFNCCETTNTWRCEVIYYIFHTTDALAIKSIPLTDLNKEDRAIRRLCIDGLLTVRSA